MTALSESLASTNAREGIDGFDDEDGQSASFSRMAIDEIERYRRIDEWILSYHNIYTTTALRCKQRLARAKVIPKDPVEYYEYTRAGTFDPLRLEAFTILVEFGLLDNGAFLHYFLFVAHADKSPFVRRNMQRLFARGLAGFAIGEIANGSVTQSEQADAGLIIEHETSATEARQADLRRTQTVSGATAALRAQLSENDVLKKALWEAVTYASCHQLENPS